MAAPRSDSDTKRSPGNSPNERDWFRIGSHDAPTESSRSPAPPPTAIPIPGYVVLGEIQTKSGIRLFRANPVGTNDNVTIIAIPAPHRPEGMFRGGEQPHRHPNWLAVQQMQEVAGTSWVVAEHLDVGRLDQWLARITLSPHQAAALAEQIAQGLHFAHEHGYVHGRLTPATIWLQSISKANDDATVRTAMVSLGAKVTDIGAESPFDAPSYAAPEVLAGEVATPPADVYSAGAVLYELLTARPPFAGQTAVEAMQAKQHPVVSPCLLRPIVPDRLDTICRKCLEANRKERYQSAAELADDLRGFLEERPIMARSRWRWKLEHPRVRVGLLIAAVVLSVFTIVASMLAGIAFFDVAETKRRHDVLRDERHKSDSERDDALIQAKATARQSAMAAREPEMSALWLAQAGRLADIDDSADRIRMRNYLRHSSAPMVAIQVESADKDPIASWSIHPTGRWLLVGSQSMVRLVDMEIGKEKPLLDSAVAQRACWSNDGNLLAIGSNERVTVSRFPEGTAVSTFNVEKGPVSALAIDPKGGLLAVGAGEIQIWDIARGERKSFAWAAPSPVTHLRFDSTGVLLMAAFHSGPTRVYRMGEEKPLAEFMPSKEVFAKDGRWRNVPQFALSGQRVVALGPSGQLVVFDVKSNRRVLELPKSPANDPAFTSFVVGDRHVAAFGDFTSIRVDLQTLQAQPIETQITGDFWSAGELDDPANYWFGSADGLFIANQHKPYRIPHNEPVLAAQKLDQNRFVTLQRDGLIRIWQLESQRSIKSFHLNVQAPLQVDSGRDFFVAGGTPILGRSCNKVFQSKNPKVPIEINGHVLAVSASPTQPLMAIGIVRAATLEDRRKQMFDAKEDRAVVELWSLDETKLRWRHALPAEPRSIEFSPNGKSIAVLTATSEVVLFDAESGAVQRRLLREPSRTEPLEAHDCGTIRFSRDGTMVVAFGLDGRLNAWETETGNFR